MKKNNPTPSSVLSSTIVEGMLEKKAKNVVLMDLREIPNSISDFFVVCSGTSDTQLDAISRSVEESVVKNLKEKPWHQEGLSNREWILMDYSDVVVHIFREERREFFDIESLWGDAIFTQFDETMNPSKETLVNKAK